MAIVFTPCAGAVGIVREGCSDTDHLSITIPGFEGIITSMSLELSGNYQFLHTLNDFIYVYAFGDRIGVFNVSGVGFTKPCDGGKGSLMKVYEYYKEKRIADPSQAVAMKIVIKDSEATGTFFGFLTGARIDATSDSAVGPLGYWSLRFELLPEA